MFSTDRDFRAVTFVFPKADFKRLSTVQHVLKLFKPGALAEQHLIDNGLEKAGIAHALFLSPTYYPRADDDELRATISVQREGATFYKYDIYLVLDNSLGDCINCTVAVPFAALGREVFVALHKAGGVRRPRYRRIDLNKALALLEKGTSEQSRIKVRSLEVPLGSEGNVDRLWLSGRDVVNSSAYRLLPKMLEVLPDESDVDRTCTAESCQLAYEGDLGVSFRLTTDNIGNYSFRIRKNPSLLEFIIVLMRFFHQHDATEDVLAWPWRGGSANPSSEEEK